MNGKTCHIIKLLLISILYTILGVNLLTTTCYAQASNTARPVLPAAPMTTTARPDSFQLDLAQDVASQLMSFEDIYEVAISYSPLVKYQNEITVSQDAAYRLSKLEILSRISGFANFSNGNQAIISSNLNNGDALGQITNGYRAGLNAQISFYELFGRPQQIRLARANYQAAMVQKDIVKLQLKRELITAYQDLITSQQILKVRIQEEQTSFAAYQIADIEARQNGRSTDELAGANSRYAQAKTIAEQAKGSFIKNTYYLEALAGVSIQQLKRK